MPFNAQWRGQRVAAGDDDTELTTAVFDTGRRGAPRPGCDCVQCFGYCMVDHDLAHRDRLSRALQEARAVREDDL